MKEKDLYNFEGLHIPINNSIEEMDMLVLSLVKVIIDSLNEKKITEQLEGISEKLTGGISKLEKWMSERSLKDYQVHIKFLRDLQELRSCGVGHRKGDGYEKISKKFNLQNSNYREVFIIILKQSTYFLRYIEEHLDELTVRA